MVLARATFYFLFVLYLFGATTPLYAGFQQLRQMAEGRAILNAPLTIDGRERGSIWIAPSENDEMFLLEASALIAQLSSLITEEKMQSILFQAESGVISERQLSYTNILLQFDSINLQLRVYIPPRSRTRQDFNIVGVRERELSEGVHVSSDYSGVLNLRPRAILNNQSDNVYGGNLQGFINLKGFAIESGVDYQDDRSREIIRDQTRVIYDDVDRSIRYTVGDITQTTQGFLTAQSGLGVSASKLLRMRPSTFQRSGLQREILIPRPSRVEVYVNGSLARSAFVSPGPLNLESFPLGSGRNDIEIVITDDRGVQERINFEDFDHPDTLAKGIDEYTLSIYYPTVFRDFKRKYETDLETLLGFYRRGINSRFTLGANFQVQSDIYQLFGMETVNLTPYGLFGTDFAWSRSKLDDQKSEAQTGAASRFRYQSLARKGSRISFLRFFGEALYQTNGFERLNLNDQAQWTVDAQVRWQALTWTQLGTGINHRSFYGSKKDLSSLRFDFLQRFSRAWSFTLNYFHGIQKDSERRVLASLNWNARSGIMQNYTSYNSQNRNLTNQSSVQHVRGSNQFKGQAVVQTDQDKEHSGNLQAEVLTQRLQARVDYRHLESESFDRSSTITRLDFGTALVFAGNDWAVSRPVTNSFAIISAKGETKRAGVIPIGGRWERAQAKIDKWGPGVIQDIQPYLPMQYSVDLAQLPFHQQLERENFKVFPGYKRGLSVDLGLISEMTLSGRVISSRGENLGLIAGNLYFIDDRGEEKFVERFFTNRDGRFFITGLRPGEYLFVPDGRWQHFSVSVHDNDDGMMALEEIILK